MQQGLVAPAVAPVLLRPLCALQGSVSPPWASKGSSSKVGGLVVVELLLLLLRVGGDWYMVEVTR